MVSIFTVSYSSFHFLGVLYSVHSTVCFANSLHFSAKKSAKQRLYRLIQVIVS